MTSRFPRTLAVPAVVVGVALLAACGSGGGDTTATSEPAGSSVAAPVASTPAAGGSFTLTSSAFGDNQPIPRKYTCQGDGVSPELTWDGMPEGTKSMALLVVDPDAGVQVGFTHWVLTGIDPAAGTLAEGTTAGTAGANSAGDSGYAGPCPPSGSHHYIFTLYALAAPIEGTPDRAAVEAAAGGALGKAVLTGTYEKS
jgi:Raf kinase inhibitor-like YbhB/YbcL family protein